MTRERKFPRKSQLSPPLYSVRIAVRWCRLVLCAICRLFRALSSLFGTECLLACTSRFVSFLALLMAICFSFLTGIQMESIKFGTVEVLRLWWRSCKLPGYRVQTTLFIAGHRKSLILWKQAIRFPKVGQGSAHPCAWGRRNKIHEEAQGQAIRSITDIAGCRARFVSLRNWRCGGWIQWTRSWWTWYLPAAQSS